MLGLKLNHRLATLVFDRPPVTAINDTFLDHFDPALKAKQQVNPALVVVRGCRQFSAGGNVAQMVGALDNNDFSRRNSFPRPIQNSYLAWEQVPMPTVAALTRAVAGRGLELSLAPDLLIAFSASYIGSPEVCIGLLPAGGGSQRSAGLIGRGTDLRQILPGEMIGGTEARDLGIAEWCLKDEEPEPKLEKVITLLLNFAGPAQLTIKRCINLFSTNDGYAGELFEQRSLHASDEAKRRLSAFISGR